MTKATIALFIIVDPLGSLPIFIGLTGKMGKEEKGKTFQMAILIALLLLLIFTIAGQQLLILFNISLQSFMIAGGVLLLIIAIKIIVNGGWEEKTISPESLGAIPITFPLLAGPGAITTTMLSLQSLGLPVTVLSVVIILGITKIILGFIDPIYKFLGDVDSVVIARVMAVFIASIVIGYIIEGIKNF